MVRAGVWLVGHRDGGAAKVALPPTTALVYKYCNFCNELLDLGLEKAPLGTAVGSVYRLGEPWGDHRGALVAHWVMPAWHVCPCAMLKWPIFPHLGAVAWEDPAGGQIWPLTESSPRGRAGGRPRAVAGAPSLGLPWGWQLPAEASGSARGTPVLPGVGSHWQELTPPGITLIPSSRPAAPEDF